MKLTPKIQKAIVKASILHNEKRRKGDGSPYITHPFSVAFILAHYTDDEDVIAAALLHDVLEDVPVHVYSAEDMKKDFGPRVLEIVKGVSEDENPIDKQSAKATWKKRKLRYLANLEGSIPEALMVCCADKTHNLSSLVAIYKAEGSIVIERFNASHEQLMWFFKEVLDIAKKKLASPLVKELEAAYGEAYDLFHTQPKGES